MSNALGAFLLCNIQYITYIHLLRLGTNNMVMTHNYTAGLNVNVQLRSSMLHMYHPLYVRSNKNPIGPNSEQETRLKFELG
jgi:hypothetical protein